MWWNAILHTVWLHSISINAILRLPIFVKWPDRQSYAACLSWKRGNFFPSILNWNERRKKKQHTHAKAITNEPTDTPNSDNCHTYRIETLNTNFKRQHNLTHKLNTLHTSQKNICNRLSFRPINYATILNANDRMIRAEHQRFPTLQFSRCVQNFFLLMISVLNAAAEFCMDFQMQNSVATAMDLNFSVGLWMWS